MVQQCELAAVVPEANGKLHGPLRLNVGSGTDVIPGYVNIDRKHGGEAYPLRLNDGTPVADGSCEEVLASHVLEHFGFHEVEDVVKEWARVLQPGGRLRIAVPDLTYIAKVHLRKKPEPYLQYLLGAQGDENDFHRSAFDRHILAELMRGAGLTRVREWKCKEGTAGLPVSLNLEGYKGELLRSRHKLPSVYAVLSLPRLAFTDNMFCALATCTMLGIPFRQATGAYWEQCLSRAIMDILEEKPDLEYILTLDYDSVFRHQDVLTLCDLAIEHPEADAIAPIQTRRVMGNFMVSILKPDGSRYSDDEPITKEHYKGDLTLAATAHFGLTLLRAEKLRKLPHPWFKSVPNSEGTWGDGRTDADIYFWQHWRECGNTLYLANRIPIGHAELVISWPKEDGGVTQQTCEAFWNRMEPSDLWT